MPTLGALAGNLDDFIQHALRDTLPAEEDLTEKNTSIAYVGIGAGLVNTFEDDQTAPYLARISGVARARLPGSVGRSIHSPIHLQAVVADVRMDDEPGPAPDPDAGPQPMVQDQPGE